MTLLQITYFLKVTECMNFSRAAEELYVSQPSVSRQIQQLEKELGMPLFDRSHKNAIRLTAAGMVFRDGFSSSMKIIEESINEAKKAMDEPSLRLRIGVGECWDLVDELNYFDKEVALRYPRADISYEFDTFQQLKSRMRSGALDAIMCIRPSLTEFDGVDIIPLADMRYRVYVRKGLLRPPGEKLRIEDFDGQRMFVTSEEETPMAMELQRTQFLAAKVKVEPVRMPNRDTILQYVLMGRGVAVFDRFMRFRIDERLDYFDLNDPMPMCLVYKISDHNPLIHYFAELMEKRLAEREIA